MRERLLVRRAVPLAMAGVLAGCALPPPSGCISEPGRDAALVTLPTEVMGEADRRVRFADPKEFDEYVLYRGGDGERLEAVYLETRFKHGTNVVLRFADPLVERTRGFAYNAGTRPEFGDAVRLDTAFGGMWVNEYTHPVTGQRCAGFVESWDERSDDPQNRPSKALYGYYCAPRGAAPDLAAADGVLSRLEAGLAVVDAGVAGPDCEKAGTRSTQPGGHELQLLAQATGGAGDEGARGHADFPPVRAVRFNDHNDLDDWD